MIKKLNYINKRWEECWNIAPDILSILRKSKSLNSARKRMMKHLNILEQGFRDDIIKPYDWDNIILKDAIYVLKNIFSIKNENIAKSSPLKYLWEAANNGNTDVQHGFIDEFEHLFRAIKFKAKIYPSKLTEGIESFDSDKFNGRKLAIERSNFLDDMGDRIDMFLKRYPTGLEPDIEKKREENKKRILKVFIKNMISHKSDRGIAFDFMREHDTSPVEHITRRYPKVIIIKPVDTCPQICVYCQRNWEITSPLARSGFVSKNDTDNAIKWISEHKHVMDILITGGDPLIMSNEKLDKLLSRLASISHLKSIRIATRIPITVPQRIDDELIEILSKYNEPYKRIIYVVTHFQHAYEISRETADAINKIRKRGIPFYNQQVFTFANSKRFESVALRIALKMIGVDPYYIFNMKGKSEISDYAVPIARLLQERKEEARLIPGIYRTDEPVFNVPFLGKNHLRARQDHELISILSNGKRVYAFHPWERNIMRVNSYIYTDVSISNYLEKLKKLGVDTEEYNSIWYYY
jgi:KamA family protein